MTIAGSKGGIYWGIEDIKGYNIPTVKRWREIGERETTGAELYCEMLPQARPTQVELGIGNTCGLECGHCFLGYRSGAMTEDLVPLSMLFELSTIFVEDFNTKIFCVTDRDALTPRRSVPFFQHLANLRQRYDYLKFGGVTNGLAISKYADELADIKLDYLDISLDGLAPEHDALRGSGTFNKTIDGLRVALAKEVAERVIISTTLTRFNSTSLLEMIRYLITEENVRWIDVGPLMAVKMADSRLGENDVVDFLDRLWLLLKDVHTSEPTTIFFEICEYCAAFMPSLINHGWLVPENIRQDRFGHLYQDIEVNESIKITLRPVLISEYWRYNLRITADGYVVGGCEPLTQSDYARHSVGNVKNASVKELYARALAIGSPFYKMMLALDFSECSDKQCFRHCLGGDSLLAKAVYDDFNRKDLNCSWNEYRYGPGEKNMAYAK